jgi:hypothetical protein
VVNGYVCFSSCDEAKAKRGKTRMRYLAHRRIFPIPKKKSAFAGQPPVILDGVLKGLANGASLPGATNIAGDTNEQPTLNILA